MTKKKVTKENIDYGKQIAEYRALLQFTCSFDNYSTPKDLFGAFDRLLKREFKTGPLVVLSLSVSKLADGKHDHLKISRNVWNRKAISTVYSNDVTRELIKNLLDSKCGERCSMGLEDSTGRSFQVMNCGVVDDQTYLAFFETFDDFNVELMPSIVQFLANSTTRLKKWKDLEKLESLVHVDDVTGLYNQRKLYKDLDNCIQRYKEISEKFSVLFIDIDHFKQVNDGHGHIIGTQLLMDVAAVLKTVLRETDLCYRYGGDEFVAIVQDSNSKNAYNIGQRILKAITDKVFEVEDIDADKGIHKIKLSVSIGVAGFPDDAETREEILEMADQMMYEAKESGRGRVCLAGNLFNKEKSN